MPSNKSSISNSCYGEDSDIPTQQRHRIMKPHTQRPRTIGNRNKQQPTNNRVCFFFSFCSLSLSAHTLFGLSLVVSKARGWDVSQIIESQITMAHAKVLVAFFAPSPFFSLWVVVHSFFLQSVKDGAFLSQRLEKTNKWIWDAGRRQRGQKHTRLISACIHTTSCFHHHHLHDDEIAQE